MIKMYFITPYKKKISKHFYDNKDTNNIQIEYLFYEYLYKVVTRWNNRQQ